MSELCGRLWADVPPHERATDQSVVAGWSGRAPHYRDRERERLRDPGPCLAAVQKPYGWLPCGAMAIPGADLCPMHGGPKNPRKVASWVRQAALAWDEGYAAGIAQSDPETSNHYRAILDGGDVA